MSQHGSTAAQPAGANKMPPWRKILLGAVLVLFSGVIVVGGCTGVVALIHYNLDETHELARNAAAHHPDIRAALGKPVTVEARFCSSVMGRTTVNRRAHDSHAFDVIGNKRKGWVEVILLVTKLSNGGTDRVYVEKMVLHVGGKKRKLDVTELPKKYQEHNPWR